ncbi:MAG: arabinogalactan endo-1,4-beta-galactosidase, partial [Muribaculaceae bacterium]|nr:arabinogalactan endo-1,4-beta-galactosidase [Muribaculaceae bacterium]
VLGRKYNCPLMVVETGVEAKKPVEGKVIMKAIIEASKNRTDGFCKGVFYWAPEAEGHYPLGAFQNNRPTAIMEAFTEAAK